MPAAAAAAVLLCCCACTLRCARTSIDYAGSRMLLAAVEDYDGGEVLNNIWLGTSDEILVAYERRRFDGGGDVKRRGGGGNVTFDPLSFSLSLRIFDNLHLKKLLPYYLLLVYSADSPDPTHLQTHSHLIQHRRLMTGKWKLERRQA